MGKGEIARYEQFLLFPQCFQKACFPGASKGVIVWEWVNDYYSRGESVPFSLQQKQLTEIYSLSPKRSFLTDNRFEPKHRKLTSHCRSRLVSHSSQSDH